MKVKISYSPDWVASRLKWKEISDFVRGTTDRVIGYLQQYPSELEGGQGASKAWESRKNRCVNENDVLPVKSILVSHLAQKVNFGVLPKNERMAMILKDATRRKVPAQKMFKKMLSAYLDDGRVAVLVDSPAEIAASAVDAALNKEYSYQVLYRASAIRYWRYFEEGPRVGQIAELIVEAPPVVIEKKTYETMRRFYFPSGGLSPDEVFSKQTLLGEELGKAKYDTESKEFEVIDEIAATIPVIPFVLVGEGLEDSAMEMICQYNRKLLNDRSARDNVLYRQNFQKVFTFGLRNEELKALTENTIVNSSNENGKVVAIPPGDAAGMDVAISKLETKLRRFGMKQMNQIVSDGSAQVQSADSKLLDMKALNEWCNEVADDFEAALTEIYSLHARYENYADPIQITIPRDFGLDDQETERAGDMVTYNMAREQNVPSVQKAILKKGVAALKNLVTSGETESEAELRQKLLQDVESAQREQLTDPFAGV